MSNIVWIDYVKILVAWAMCLICMLNVGSLLAKVLHFTQLPHLNIIWGTVAILAYAEVIYLICLTFGLPFEVFLYTLTGSVVLLTICSMLILVYRHKLLHLFFKLEKSYALAYLMLGVLCISSIMLKWGNSGDDEFYLGKASEIIFSRNINPVQPAAAGGLLEAGNFPRADASSMIVVFACISKILSIHPVIVARTVIPPLIMIIGYCVIKEMACSIFDDSKQQRNVFVISLAILLCLKNDSAYQVETFFIKYPWYGIVIMTIWVYLFISQIAKLYSDDELAKKGYFWIRITLINLAILQCEIVAPFIILCMFIIYGIPFWISNKRMLMPSLKGAFISLIPVLVCGVYILKVYYGNTVLVGSEINRSWKEIVYGYFLYGRKFITFYFLLLVLSLIFFTVRGKGKKRYLFVYPSVILAITFANPILFDFVSNYITSKDAYYRLFFVIPVFFIIASFIAIMMTKNKVVEALFTFVTVIVICISAFSLLVSERTTNLYKEDEESLQFICDLHQEYQKKVLLIVPCVDSEKIHIYDYNIKYVCSRYSSSEIITGTEYTYLSLYNAACNKDLNALETLKRLGADCVIYDGRADLTLIQDKYSQKKIDAYKVVFLND